MSTVSCNTRKLDKLYPCKVEVIPVTTSIKYKVERDEQYLPYIELGRWLCSHFQLETPLNFHKPITQKLCNLEQ